MSIGAVMLIKVSCSNLEKSAAFYALLGFTPLGAVNPSSDRRVSDLYGLDALPRSLMIANADGFKIELVEWDRQGAPLGGFDTPGAGAMTLKSSDIDADHAALVAAGADVVSAPVGLEGPKGTSWLANLRDPDGFVVQLFQFRKAVA
jgi:catechol 2,3-dioxygenase-like lactoylglutathione lyase family enzyme